VVRVLEGGREGRQGAKKDIQRDIYLSHPGDAASSPLLLLLLRRL